MKEYEKRPNNKNVTHHFWVAAYDDDHWAQYEELETCSQKLQIRDLQRRFNIPLDGSWTEWNLQKQTMRYRTKMYYFVAFDCDATMHGSDASMPQIQVEF